MSDEMKFPIKELNEEIHRRHQDDDYCDIDRASAEVGARWAWSRALASQPKGREWWMREVPDGDAYIKWQVFGPGVLLDTIKKKNHDTFIHIREVLASQAADEGKVGWGPLPTTEHYQEEDPRDARIAELEAANENLKMLIRRVYRKLKIARSGSAIDLLDEAFDLWKGSILRGSDGGGG